MAHERCPRCGKKITWRNDEYVCKKCGNYFCKSCAKYGFLGVSLKCPVCGSGKVERVK